MRILSIETSCDETSAAVVEKIGKEPYVNVLSNITATSLAIHATTGGVIPENAAREQVKYIIPTIVKALNESRGQNSESWKEAQKILIEDIDAIAVTYGPGLIGSLLIGVETVKTLSYVFDKPVIPVNHLLAHIFANFINPSNNITFPFIGLIISGGHTDLLYFESIEKYKWLGGTRDDAAGEALDKIGRLLNLPYPAGPEIERRASKIQKSTSNIQFKSPMMGSKTLDFSFSGLKSEASRFIQSQNNPSNLTEELINQICYAVQNAIFAVLIKKTVHAASKHNCSTILIGGGVSANQTLLERFKKENPNLAILSPERKYSTDNGAMIGAYAALNPKAENWQKIESTPDLYFQ